MHRPPNLIITWIRHGETDWNACGRWQGHSESALSERGRAQALALNRRFRRAGYRFDQIVCSDLGRAVETAALVFPEQTVEPDPRLREIHFGRFEGQRWSELSSQEQDELERWWRSPYDFALSGGGESMAEVRHRVDAWLKEQRSGLHPESAPWRLAVVTHGGVIRDALWRETSPPSHGAWSFQIENTSLTVIAYESERRLIQRTNDCAHLEES